MGFRYQFPKIKGCESFTLQEQMAKINEESYELQMEILAENQSRRWIFLEGMNVIHAIETLFHAMEATEAELDAAVEETVYDNRERGYYDE